MGLAEYLEACEERYSISPAAGRGKWGAKKRRPREALPALSAKVVRSRGVEPPIAVKRTGT